MSQQKILVVDDELGIRNLIEKILTPKYKVYLTSTCPEGFMVAVEKQPDLIILDLTFPEGQNGYDYCKIMKKDIRIKHIPIIMLTGQWIESKDEVKGLKLGAEDYITKPFDSDALIERIKKALKKDKQNKSEQNTISIGNVNLHYEPMEIVIGRKKGLLTREECEVLRILMKHQGRLVEYDVFNKYIWKYEKNHSFKKGLKCVIGRLRKKLGPKYKDTIKTVKNKGYFFDGITRVKNTETQP